MPALLCTYTRDVVDATHFHRLNRIVLFGGSDGRARLSDAQVLQLQVRPEDDAKAAAAAARQEADPSTVEQPYFPRLVHLAARGGGGGGGGKRTAGEEKTRYADDGRTRRILRFGPSFVGCSAEGGTFPADLDNGGAGSRAGAIRGGSYLGGWDASAGGRPHGEGRARWMFRLPKRAASVPPPRPGNSKEADVHEDEDTDSDEDDLLADEEEDEEEVYVGQWSAGCRHGQGTQSYSGRWRGGGQYVGAWRDDKPHGQGRRDYDWPTTKPNGEPIAASSAVRVVRYEGQWDAGEWCGAGVLTFSDGTTCAGDAWPRIARDLAVPAARGGQAAVLPPHLGPVQTSALCIPAGNPSRRGGGGGGQYVGEVELEMCGSGSVSANRRVNTPRRGGGGGGRRKAAKRGGNAVAVRLLEAPLRHGRGKQVYSGGGSSGAKGVVTAKGDVYDGQWHADRRHGIGTMQYADGSSYAGEWRNDQLNGKGRLALWTGETYAGKFIGGERNGIGRCVFANGAVYEGEWKRGQPHGKVSRVAVSSSMLLLLSGCLRLMVARRTPPLWVLSLFHPATDPSTHRTGPLHRPGRHHPLLGGVAQRHPRRCWPRVVPQRPWPGPAAGHVRQRRAALGRPGQRRRPAGRRRARRGALCRTKDVGPTRLFPPPV